MKYYSLKNILKQDCRYNLMFGERSSGKTYAVLYYMLERYLKHGEQGIVLLFSKGENNYGCIRYVQSGEWERRIHAPYT